MASFECGIVEFAEDLVMNPFLTQCHADLECFLGEQNEISKEVKLSYLLQLDDTFSTEDRWPI